MICILSQLKLFTKNAPFWCQGLVVVIHTLFVSIGSFHQLLRWQHWRYWIIGWQGHRTATTSDDREQRILWAILTFLLLYSELFVLRVRMTFWGQWWGRWGTARSVLWSGTCPSLAFWSQFTYHQQTHGHWCERELSAGFCLIIDGEGNAIRKDINHRTSLKCRRICIYYIVSCLKSYTHTWQLDTHHHNKSDDLQERLGLAVM